VKRRPHVVVHVAVSLDGSIEGFEPDVARFYELARTFEEDVTLAGADTILAQEAVLADVPRPGPTEGAPVLAVVDGRRRVREWDALRDCGHWSDAIGLFAEPGADHVDLGAALTRLGERYDARTVRVDSGGGLNGALLERDLVDEISLLVHPVIVGRGRRWHGDVPARRSLTGLRAEGLGDDLLLVSANFLR
jgi:2,5-diamino-6-(ribosylamino)-4(3H)-pyrimidinone 5'-phosphate reductase